MIFEALLMVYFNISQDNIQSIRINKKYGSHERAPWTLKVSLLISIYTYLVCLRACYPGCIFNQFITVFSFFWGEVNPLYTSQTLFFLEIFK